MISKISKYKDNNMKTNVLGTEMTKLIFFPYFCVSIFE